MIIQILRLEQCDLENGVPTEWLEHRRTQQKGLEVWNSQFCCQGDVIVHLYSGPCECALISAIWVAQEGHNWPVPLQ